MNINIVLVAFMLINSSIGMAKTAVICPDAVRVTFLDAPSSPYINGAGQYFEDPPGYLINWTKAAIGMSGCNVKLILSRRPIKRAYKELENGDTDFITFATPTIEHLDVGIFPRLNNGTLNENLSFLSTSLSLWVRTGESKFTWDGNHLTGPVGFKVGVAPFTLQEQVANQKGWDTEAALNGENNILMLVKGRTDIAITTDVVAYSYMNHTGAEMERLAPAVSTSKFYLAASRQFYAQYANYTGLIWKAMCEVAHSDKTLHGTGTSKSSCH